MNGKRLGWDEPVPSDLYGDTRMVTLPSGRQCPADVAAAMFPRERATLVERFVARLERDHGIVMPTDWEFHRVYGGYWDRARGAWSWFITGTDTHGRPGTELVASHYSVTALMKAQAWMEPKRSGPSGPALEIDPV